MKITLSTPEIMDKKGFLKMIQEFKDNNEKIIPSAMRTKENETFEQFLQRKIDRNQGKNIPDGYVPDSLFFIKNKEGKIVGGINIRHILNDFLRDFGGHIGYGVRPSERKKGYATEALKLGLQECKKLGINEVIITCEKENIGSSKTIQNNGGIFDKEFIQDGIINQRWIINL